MSRSAAATDELLSGRLAEVLIMPLSIRLTKDEEARLSALAARTGRSKAFYVRQAIKMHLDEVEELYWADEAVR